MKDITVRALTADQFEEVARHYSWSKYRLHDRSSLYQIYFRDGKPSEYDYNEVDKYFQDNKKITFVDWIQLTNPKTNNMKYVVEVNNQSEADIVYAKFDKPGMHTNYLVFPECISSETSQHGDVKYHSSEKGIKQYGPIVKFKDWALTLGIQIKPNKTLKLTSDYSAEVNYSTKIVQVGCQSIPFSKVEELAKLIKE